MIVVQAAYGRNYKNQTQIKEDWLANKDFMTLPDCRYINNTDYTNLGLTEDIQVRYGLMNNKVMTFNPSRIRTRKPTRKKTTAKAKALSFDQWMSKVDAAIATELLGLTTGDLADMDYYRYYETGTKPARMAKIAMNNEFSY